MKRSAPLTRTVPLARTPGPSRSPRARKAPKDTGPPPAVRKLVLERDDYACVCCGRSIIGQRYSLQHRVRRSHGGGSAPENLVTVLGWGGEACHGRIDLYRDPADEAKGYRLPPGTDPALVPVTVFSEHGSGMTLWPAKGGRWSAEPPERGAAS